MDNKPGTETLNKSLIIVDRCIKSAFSSWDKHNVNDDMLSDIEVDLEHALAALQVYRSETNWGE
jgi:hypothetical protein